jgi:hypothetical protein
VRLLLVAFHKYPSLGSDLLITLDSLSSESVFRLRNSCSCVDGKHSEKIKFVQCYIIAFS